MKRETPYSRLLATARKYASDVKYRHRKVMWTYPKARLSEGFEMASLAERVKAADQLGYDVELSVNSEGDLVVQYAKRPSLPWELAP